MQTIQYRRLTIGKLTEIKTLWEELNKTHLVDSVYFKEHYATFCFEKRSAIWLELPEDHFQLLVAETKDATLAGYCVSTISMDQKGEIDSLFVSPSFRQQGIGRALVEKSIEWLQNNQCDPIRLTVSYGHESVFAFYQQLGFYPRLTALEFRDKVIESKPNHEA
jgi:Acetyltransferases